MFRCGTGRRDVAAPEERPPYALRRWNALSTPATSTEAAAGRLAPILPIDPCLLQDILPDHPNSHIHMGDSEP